MQTEHITIFSGSSIIVKGLQKRLEDIQISAITRDRFESARLAGFGEDRNAVELLILESEVKKAQPIVDAYKEEINS